MTVLHQVALCSTPSAVGILFFLRVLRFDSRAPYMGSPYSYPEALLLLFAGMCEFGAPLCDSHVSAETYNLIK